MPGRLRIDVIASGPARLFLGARVVRRARVAARWVPRLVGLLGTPDLHQDEALILVPCAAVHGVGMRCSIGVAFVDGAGRVLRVVDPLPWWGARARGAHVVVESPSGVLSAVSPGDTLWVDDARIFPLRGISASTAGGAIVRPVRCPVTDGTPPTAN